MSQLIPDSSLLTIKVRDGQIKDDIWGHRRRAALLAKLIYDSLLSRFTHNVGGGGGVGAANKKLLLGWLLDSFTSQPIFS